MKKIIKITVLAALLSLVFSIFPGQKLAQQNGVNFQLFYDKLSPYGQWIENDDYGYVWIPDAEPGFSPYLTNGYWVLTDYGWMWISDYEWGWAAFHYGRWDYNNSYGWFWVPDNDWGPSWVMWRRAEGYYGWAPMRPGISISIIFAGYNDVPDTRWIFVKDKDFERHDIGRNYIDQKRNYEIIKSSKVITRSHFDDNRRTTFISGPDREDVQRNTGKSINPVTVRERNMPGYNLNNGQLQIYQPRIEKGYNITKPAPSKFVKIDDINKIQRRNLQRGDRNFDLLNNKEDQKGDRSLTDRLNNDRREKIKQMEHPPQKENIENPSSNPRKKDTQIKVNDISKPVNPRIIRPVEKEAKIDQTLPRKKIDWPKENKNLDKQQKVRAIDPQKKTNIEKPIQSNENKDKKKREKRNDLLVLDVAGRSFDVKCSDC